MPLALELKSGNSGWGPVVRPAVKLRDMPRRIFRKLLLCSNLAVECDFGQG
jgi:hypothetical protein